MPERSPDGGLSWNWRSIDELALDVYTTITNTRWDYERVAVNVPVSMPSAMSRPPDRVPSPPIVPL